MTTDQNGNYYKTKLIETIVYGVAGMTFAVAFFFGIMYPQYGVAKNTYQADGQAKYSVSRLQEMDCGYELRQLKKLRDEEKLSYASYFYDCLIGDKD